MATVRHLAAGMTDRTDAARPVRRCRYADRSIFIELLIVIVLSIALITKIELMRRCDLSPEWLESNRTLDVYSRQYK
ncbi:protein of unknown function (plasmid) [Caballeronia sp. S22]